MLQEKTLDLKIAASVGSVFKEPHLKSGLNLLVTHRISGLHHLQTVSHTAHTQNAQEFLCKHEAEKIQNWQTQNSSKHFPNLMESSSIQNH